VEPPTIFGREDLGESLLAQPAPEAVGAPRRYRPRGSVPFMTKRQTRMIEDRRETRADVGSEQIERWKVLCLGDDAERRGNHFGPEGACELATTSPCNSIADSSRRSFTAARIAWSRMTACAVPRPSRSTAKVKALRVLTR
jgi:hypothetical protein